MNYSVTMKNVESQYSSKYIKNDSSIVNKHKISDVYFELDWENAIPISFFSFKPQTKMSLYMYSEYEEKIVNVKSLKMIMNGFSYEKEFEIIKSSVLNKKVDDVYYNRIVIDLYDFLPNGISKAEDLLQFENIDIVEIQIQVEVDSGEERTLVFKYKPILNKSIRSLDSMMSV